MTSGTFTRKDVVVACLCVLVAAVTVSAVGRARRELAGRLICEQNLRQIGRAMLIYANDFEDELPRAGGRASQWAAKIPSWRAKTRNEAFGMDANYGNGKATTTASLYLLIRYAELTPSQCVCKSERGTWEFRLDDVPEELPEGFALGNAWDFGGWYDSRNNPARHCSYAYHMPFGRWARTTSIEPGLPVLADRNPWIDPNRVADPNEGWDQFDPADPDRVRLGNSEAHQREGQYVHYVDNHVEFQSRATCGLGGDNIYTIASDASAVGRAKGLVPVAYRYDDSTPGAHPFDRKDTVLVQESGELPPSE